MFFFSFFRAKTLNARDSLERHAPLSVEMCVLPSLSVAASVLPSYSKRGEYVLSLEATNYRSSGDDVSDNKHLRLHKVGVGEG